MGNLRIHRDLPGLRLRAGGLYRDNESLKRQREEIMDIMMALFDQETLMKRDFWTSYEYI